MVPFLQMRNISKTFPGVKALRNVDLALAQGEVHALAGENGAGKSTLMKIMTGVIKADPGGEILIEGQPVDIRDPIHARTLGISIIYQELSMVENLTVAENIFLGSEPRTRAGFVDFRRMHRDAREVMGHLELDIDPGTPVGDLSIGQKQMIEIAKAISYDSRIIVMDEPTASLSLHETETLIRLIHRLKARNIGIVYISHRLDEIFEVADHVTILRDGAAVDSLRIEAITRDLLVRKMVDRDLSELYGDHHSHVTDTQVLAARHLTLKRPSLHGAKVRDVSFELHKGEILGFFGLIGSGRTEIMEMIFGIREYSGEILIDGRKVDIRNPETAIRLGIGFVTEDRKGQGLVLGMNVRENFSLTHLKDYCDLSFIRGRKESTRTREFVATLGIKTPSIEQKVVNLSGGNQQKVAIAKWVARRPQILIVDEPTRGIDVGAKAEVHALLEELAREGMAIIVVSSDLPEVIAISDRVIVVKEGRIGGVLSREEAGEEPIMQAATG